LPSSSRKSWVSLLDGWCPLTLPLFCAMAVQVRVEDKRCEGVEKPNKVFCPRRIQGLPRCAVLPVAVPTLHVELCSTSGGRRIT
jgi:hypothetical protein